MLCLSRIRHNPLQDTPDSLTPMPDLGADVKKFGEENSSTFRFQHILKVCQSAPYEKVVQGWFENDLNLKQFVLMESILCELEWTLFVDMQLREIMHSQAWTLMAYLPFACVAHHFRFASVGWPDIKFPPHMQEMNQKLAKNQNLVAAMVSDMRPSTRAFTGTTQLVCDILPFLVHITQPTLRPVSTQLYSKDEKRDLAGLVDTMIGYNLTHTQEKNVHCTISSWTREYARFPCNGSFMPMELLGRGAFGAVYRGKLALGRDKIVRVAIKEPVDAPEKLKESA
ncbi:Chromosome transmission fidelity protein 18 [Chionoecetes opilio]|uniref:Chromosome transmission fidelity protein 18 n=1 Tax=Chionoecetes opilio TaxID=41210 RepID=A0A8J4Y3C9_CHIOP|nr:Chromosome transmission fidelity protein 18 [Chionoecetes opilio]